MWKPRQIGSKTLTFEMIEEKKILKIKHMSGNEIYLGWESVSEVWSLESVLRYRLSYSSGSNFKYFYEDVVRAVAEMSGDVKINIYNIMNRLSEKSDDVCCMLEVLLFMPEKALFDVQLERRIQEQGQKRVKKHLLKKMWMLYAQEHWTKSYDLKSAVKRLYKELGALEFDADHEAIYGMERYYTVQQCEELRDKYKIGRKVCRKFLQEKTCSQCLVKRISEIGLRHFLDTVNKYIKDCSDSSSSSDEEVDILVKRNILFFAEDKLVTTEKIGEIRNLFKKVQTVEDSFRRKIETKLIHALGRLQNCQRKTVEDRNVHRDLKLSLGSVKNDFNKLIRRYERSLRGVGKGLFLHSIIERIKNLRVARSLSEEDLFRSVYNLFEGPALQWYLGNCQKITDFQSLVLQLQLQSIPCDYDKELDKRTQRNGENIGMYVTIMNSYFDKRQYRIYFGTPVASGEYSGYEFPELYIEPEEPQESFDFTGRRIVDIQYLFKCLQSLKHEGFNSTFSNEEITNEKRIGFCSIFTSKCKMCNKVDTLSTEDPAKEQLDVATAAVSVDSIPTSCIQLAKEQIIKYSDPKYNINDLKTGDCETMLLNQTIYYLNKSKSKWISVFGRSKQYVIFKEEEWIQFHEQRENINKYFQTFDTMWKPRQIGSKTLTFEMIEEKKILKIEDMSENEVYLGWESVSEVWSLESVLRYRLSYSSGSNFKYFYEDVIRAVAEMSGDVKINIYNIINRLSEKSDDVCCMLEVLLFMPEKALFDVQLERRIQEQGQKRVKKHLLKMWMLYALEHWTKSYDLKSAVERLYEELGALEFDADHEAIYGMERYYTVQQCEELRDKYKIGRKFIKKMWMLYAEQHSNEAIDLKSAVERLHEKLGASEFDAAHRNL
ncbi:hypothetical protein FQA39_LY17446 [Lamprigera yunnana]|nr:hypothetical protein FQA39_LY17446 [Lamprigera yunnana]